MFNLRPYQTEAVDAFFSALSTHDSVGTIMPTGSGKTEVFVEICRRFTEANPTKSVLILSHLSLLTEQTKERFQKRAPQITVDIMQGQRKAKWNSSVIISTMQTSRSLKHIEHMKENTIRQVGLIIVDEAHYVPTESYQKILSYFPEAKLAGFTATPFRDKKLMTTYFSTISYSVSLNDLIKQGYLVPPKLHQILTKQKDVENLMVDVLQLCNTSAKGKQTIVYLQTIDACRMLRSSLEEIGISSHAVTQELTGDYRQSILSRFNSKDIQVLTTVNVLTAGFDSPCVEAIVMPYGTKSPTTYLQRIGRGLRPAPGKEHCDVYVFGDAPSVSRKIYEKMTNKILSAGGVPKVYPTHSEDKAFNDYEVNSDVYVYNQTVLNAIKKMQKLGMTTFAHLMDNKKFPSRFMQDLTKTLEALPSKKAHLRNPNDSATSSQVSVLLNAGFPAHSISAVTKGEASMMISTIFNRENRKTVTDNRFTIPEGMHKGKQVFETPHAYRTTIKKNFPDSPVSKIINQWEERRKA